MLASLSLMRVAELFPVERHEPADDVARHARGPRLRARTRASVLVILGMMVVFASLCFNFNILLPVLAKRDARRGPAHVRRALGRVRRRRPVGALVGAPRSRARRWKTMLIGAAGFALCELAIAPVRSVPLRLVLLFACGIFFTSYTANTNARIQLDAPDHLRGRVLSLYYYAWNGLAPLGGLIIGWLSRTGGTQLAFTVAGPGRARDGRGRIVRAPARQRDRRRASAACRAARPSSPRRARRRVVTRRADEGDCLGSGLP